MTTTAAAPSLSCDELPAVIEEDLSSTPRSAASPSSERHALFVERASLFLCDVFPRGKRRQFRIEGTPLLRDGRALLRLQRVFILPFARNAVLLCHEVGRLQHRRVHVGFMAEHPLLGEILDVEIVLHE